MECCLPPCMHPLTCIDFEQIALGQGEVICASYFIHFRGSMTRGAVFSDH